MYPIHSSGPPVEDGAAWTDSKRAETRTREIDWGTEWPDSSASTSTTGSHASQPTTRGKSAREDTP